MKDDFSLESDGTAVPALDVLSTLLRLLRTQLHMIMRFDQYLKYPIRGWRLARKYNPENYVADIVEFLGLDASLLDVGYFWQLQRTAWANAEDVEARALDQPAVVISSVRFRKF